MSHAPRAFAGSPRRCALRPQRPANRPPPASERADRESSAACRHLAAEGATFRLLIDEVRSALAEEMLSHHMSVAEVAERLGYAKAASFSHAFKRRRGPRKCTGPAPE